MAGCFPGVSEYLHGDNPHPLVSDVTCDAADAAYANAAVSTRQWWTAQAGSGRGSRRTSAEVSGKEQSGGNKVQTEEKSMGDVIREESGRTHADQHAASGTQSNTSLKTALTL